jgi:mercuric ion transport protein
MPDAPVKTVTAAVGGVAAAFGSALCCAGPLLAVAAGFSGAGFATAFEPWRPVFVGAAVLGLGYGHWALRREEQRACVPGQPCASPLARRWMKRTIWTATVLAIPLVLFPWWSGFLLN